MYFSHLAPWNRVTPSSDHWTVMLSLDDDDDDEDEDDDDDE